MSSLFNEAKKKQTQSKKNVNQQNVSNLRKNVESSYTKRLSSKQQKYYKGNRVKDAMSTQQYYNNNPSKSGEPYNKLLLNDDRLFTGGRAHWKLGQDVKGSDGKKTGEFKKYDSNRIQQNYALKGYKNAGTGGKVKKLADNEAREYKRNMDKSWGKEDYNLSPIHKVEPTGKKTSPIKEGFKQASKTKNPLGKVGAIAGGVAGGAFNGFMEVADLLNTLNYGAHGFSSGLVEGFNNNGKLDKGEIQTAFKNATSKGSKGLKAGLSGENEGRYGWYDTLKAFSDDKLERDVRKGKIFTEADEKKRNARLSAIGLGLDIGGALLTANAGTLATKGAQLVSKGSKLSGNAVKGLSKIAKVADLGIDLPVADLVRGTGKTFSKTGKVATNFDELAPQLVKQMDNLGISTKSHAVADNIVQGAVNKTNKARGIRDVNYGVRLGGFNVTSPKVVQNIADSPLNVPGRALNSVIDQIHAKRIAKANTAQYAPNLMNEKLARNIQKGLAGKQFNQKTMNADNGLQVIRNRDTFRELVEKLERAKNPTPGLAQAGDNIGESIAEPIIAGKPLSYWKNMQEEVGQQVKKANQPISTAKPGNRQEWIDSTIKKNTENLRNGVKPTPDKVENVEAMINASDPYWNVRNEKALDNQFLNKIAQEKPALGKFIDEKMSKPKSNIKNSSKTYRMNDEGSDAFYDFLEKNNPKLYKKLTGESDTIDNILESTVRRQNTIIDDAYTRKMVNMPEKRSVKNAVTPQYKDRILPMDKYLKENPTAVRKSLKESQSIAKTGTGNFIKKTAPIDDKSYQGAIELRDKLKKMSNYKNKTGLDKQINELNNMLFNGENIIRNNIPKNDLRQFINYLEDSVNYNVMRYEMENLGATHVKYPMREKGKTIHKPFYNNQGMFNNFDVRDAMYSRGLTDVNAERKFSIVDSLVGAKNKKELTDQIKDIKAKFKKGTATTDEMAKLQDLEHRLSVRDKIYKDIKELDVDELDKYIAKNYPNHDALGGYNKALDETAVSAVGKEKFEDVVTAEKGTREYKKQMEEWDKIKLDREGEKARNQLRNNEAKHVKIFNNTKKIASPRAEQELVEGVGEYFDDAVRQAKALKKKFKLQDAVAPKLKVGAGQKLGTLPPVQHNTRNLRKTIETEMELMHKSPDQYKSMQSAFKEIKKEYVNALRKIGVPDKGYFDKVKALQDDLNLYYKELSKSSTKKDSPLIKMDLQTLARRVSDTFDELEKSIAKSSKLDATELSPISKLSEKVKPTKYIDPKEHPNVTLDKQGRYIDLDTGEILEGTYGTPAKAKSDNVTPIDKLQGNSTKTSKNGSQSLRAPYQNQEQKIGDFINKHPEKTYQRNAFDKIMTPLDALTKEFKAGITKNNLGWQGMNAVQNKLNSGYGIGTDVFNRKLKKQAKDVVSSLEGQKEYLGQKFGKEVTESDLKKIKIGKDSSGKPMTLADVRDVIKSEGLIDDNIFTDTISNKGIGRYLLPSGDKSIFTAGGADKLIRTESNDKVQHVLSRLNKGDNINQAIESAKDKLFDYDAISDFEKRYMKRAMPFYTYYRKNIPLQLKQFANSPRAMSQYLDAKNQFEKGIDDKDKQRRNEWTADRLQIPNTTKVEKGKEDNMYNMMLNTSTPWDALMQLPHGGEGGINNLPSANPIIESLYRYYGEGKDFFGEDLGRNGDGRTIGEYLGEQYLKPTLGMLGQVKDVKKANSKQNEQLEMLKMLTGVKAKYYKSNREWNFDDDDEEDKKKKSYKKVLVNKYK